LNIIKEIKDVLLSDRIAKVPGFGTFQLLYHPAEIQAGKDAIEPPTEELTFEFDKSSDDTKLAEFLAGKNPISIESVNGEISSLVDYSLTALEKDGTVSWEKFGIFRKDKQQNIVFTPDSENELLASSQLYAQVLLHATQEMKETKKSFINPQYSKPEAKMVQPVKQKAKQKLHVKWLWVFIPLVILICGGIAYWQLRNADKFLSYLKSKGIDIAMIFPGRHAENKEKRTVLIPSQDSSAISKSIDSVTDKQKALSLKENNEPKVASVEQKEVSVTSGLKYYIISGSFKKQFNAEVLKKQMKEKGFEAEILKDGEYFRVSIKKFTQKNSAFNELEKLRNEQKNQNLWLLTLK
jgi:nucleoid DNA-binding protein